MMECGNIRQRLSSYLEGIASSDEKKVIEEHLVSCEACSLALKDLKRTGELVRALEEVEPPAWMKQKVLAQIRREQEAKRSILEKFFLPLRIKIPIQAAATILIAFLAVYVFKAGGPEMKRVPSPVVTDEVTSKGEIPRPPSAPAAGTVAPEPTTVMKEMSKSGGRQGVSPPVEEKKKGDMAQLDREKAGEAMPPPEAPGPGRREEAGGKPAESGKLVGPEGQGASSPGAYPMAGGVKTEEYGAARDSLTKERKAPGAALTFRAAEAKRVEAITITVQVRDVTVAVAEIEDLLRQLGATRVDRESVQNGETITTDVPSEKVEEFMEKLKIKGEIRQKELPLPVPKGDTRIRLEILSVR